MYRVFLLASFLVLFFFSATTALLSGDDYVVPQIDSPGKTIGSDFDGDGVHDFIVGADRNDDGTGDGAGAAYVFFGSTTLTGTTDLGGAGSSDVTIFGKADSDYLGRTASGAGDLNGDGLDDIIVGAGRNNDGTGSDAGAAYVFFGLTTLSGTQDLGGGASSDVTILGKADSDLLGERSVSEAGDVNGDGFDDFIVGAHQNDDGAGNAGAAYIFFGASDLSGTKNLGGGESSDVTILGKAGVNYLGFSVSGAGDLNGDGLPDLIIGSSHYDVPGRGNAGAAYIVFGASNLSGTKDVENGDEDAKIIGKASNDYLGRSVGGGRSNPGP